ncbi:hypothetical protein [Azovibrio restrictus]|uniref:hypothetical protein n=1 Tax=Azovibrio restrictus TaxID=146938 RepID=UPI0026F302B4|nr:hypothetical protein [Azovibrio restrictus]MDD3482327.1 hypothetical protein [Azovibrio restrictus]
MMHILSRVLPGERFAKTMPKIYPIKISEIENNPRENTGLIGAWERRRAQFWCIAT